jgi:hypothetical protein
MPAHHGLRGARPGLRGEGGHQGDRVGGAVTGAELAEADFDLTGNLSVPGGGRGRQTAGQPPTGNGLATGHHYANFKI